MNAPVSPIGDPATDEVDPRRAIVETIGLTKRFGNFHALIDCSVRVQRGEVFGLLGPNGAGKTTFLRLLLGYLFPSAGKAIVNGIDSVEDSVAVRRAVSYLPGDARLPRHMKGRAVLNFFAEMQPDGDLGRSLSVADRLELDLSPRVAFMSTGMRQKVALSVVLGARTPLLILDEPTANLDPTVRAVVLEMVAEAQREGRTVMFSSHVLAEIEDVCTRVAFLRRGKLVRKQRLADLKQRHRIVAHRAAPITEIPETVASLVELRHDVNTGIVHMDTTGDLAPLLGWLGSLQLERMRVEPLGLRAIYDEVHDAVEPNGSEANR
ncbi:MAG: ATP-binding cassette domain-containing protein [Pirellulaceae bacterium]